jgi:hypothetical protein
VGKSSVASISFNSVLEEKPTREKEPPVMEKELEKPGTVDGRSHVRWLRKWGWEEGIWVCMEDGLKFQRFLSNAI